jgi:hypothetical protein
LSSRILKKTAKRAWNFYKKEHSKPGIMADTGKPSRISGNWDDYGKMELNTMPEEKDEIRTNLK